RQPLGAADVGTVKPRPRIGPYKLQCYGIDFEYARTCARERIGTIGRVRIREAVTAGPAVVEHHHISGAWQALRNNVSMMLADDLTNGAQLFRFAEVGAEPPDDLSVSSDNGKETGLPAADNDIIRSE